MTTDRKEVAKLRAALSPNPPADDGDRTTFHWQV